MNNGLCAVLEKRKKERKKKQQVMINRLILHWHVLTPHRSPRHQHFILITAVIIALIINLFRKKNIGKGNVKITLVNC